MLNAYTKGIYYEPSLHKILTLEVFRNSDYLNLAVYQTVPTRKYRLCYFSGTQDLKVCIPYSEHVLSRLMWFFTIKGTHSISLLNFVFSKRNMIFFSPIQEDVPLLEQSDRLSDPNVPNFAKLEITTEIVIGIS